MRESESQFWWMVGMFISKCVKDGAFRGAFEVIKCATDDDIVACNVWK